MERAEGRLEVAAVNGDAEFRGATALLDDAERDASLPLVDEAEHQRLAEVARGSRPAGWYASLVRRDGEPAAYVSVLLSDGPGPVSGEVAVRRPIRDAIAVTTAALDAARAMASGHLSNRLRIWMRAVGPAEQEAADLAGFTVARRLAVLGRLLEVDDAPTPGAGPGAPAPSGIEVRRYRPGTDDEAVVAVLAAAYEGTEEAGWDLDRFLGRTSLPWFRPEDLLLAVDGSGEVLGLHWTKRRGGSTGEVYNLAIHPTAQGRGLGPLLLRAGLDHLAATGCDEVLLWVDRANERAVRVYEANGFTTRWEDVALDADLAR